MQLIEGVALSKLCDYSFGDQSGQWGKIYTSFMKESNLLNLDFVDKVFQIKKERNYMSLFIDNIRLYKREISQVKPEDRDYVNSLMDKNDLLELCSNFKDMNFIIFTNLEDTPIDEYIFDKIPENVLSVNAVNAISYGGKVNPIPYGLQRAMDPSDDRVSITTNFMGIPDINPSVLLYINHSDNTNTERIGIRDIFKNKPWAVAQDYKISYSEYLEKIRQSKFVVCPIGNAIDCHRNWEVLYMRRVPVMKRYDYLEYLFKDYPVLFVDKYEDINEDLLLENEDLYLRSKTINLDNWDLNMMYDKIMNDSISRL